MDPSFSCGNDGIGIGGPDEGLGFGGVVFVDDAADGVLEFAYGAADAVFETASCQLGEDAFERVQPRARGGGDVEGPARMACKPDLDVLVLVSSVVVEDGMDRDAGGYRVRDAVKASRERLVAMPTGVPLRL